jgi:hypothetical protein
VRKKIVPPGQTVNGKFYCKFLRRLKENMWRKPPESWRNNTCEIHHYNLPVYASPFVRQLLVATNTTATPNSLPSGPHPLWHFPIRQDETEGVRFRLFSALKNPNGIAGRDDDAETKCLQQCFRSWKSRWNRCVISEGATSTGMEANRNFG